MFKNIENYLTSTGIHKTLKLPDKYRQYVYVVVKNKLEQLRTVAYNNKVNRTSQLQSVFKMSIN